MALVSTTSDNEVKNSDILLTFKKLKLQWWINKQKNEPDVDYSTRITFLTLDVKEKYHGRN